MQAQLELPESVRTVVESLRDAARDAFGDGLRSVVLYGSAAEGKLRATSDVNVLFVLSRFDADAANRFREPFRFAHSAATFTAMFLLEDEMEGAAEAFAQKVVDTKPRHEERCAVTVAEAAIRTTSRVGSHA